MYSIEQKVSAVQAYINHLKGVEVKINVELIKQDIFQEMKLNQSFNFAIQFFENNGGKIISI